MSLEDLRNELSDEVSLIFDSQFEISITSTNTVPQPDDPAITFPNLDTQTQGAKLITTCVLYIDMRKSTDLSFAHKPQTVAKLYSAFVRAMTRTARHYRGHVRGIIGDRVMVLFDVEDCFANAVHCAIAMNTVAQHIINKHFKANEVRFGIGIDHGRMLVPRRGYDGMAANRATTRTSFGLVALLMSPRN
jgi:adenylate cyclase